MGRLPKNHFISFGVSVAIIALLSAFSYPLVREGYRHVSDDTFTQAQGQLLEQSISMYLAFKPNVNWDANTPTRRILEDLAVGVDRDISGKSQSFLPANETPEGLAHNYRILYKGPNSFKVIAK